MDSLPRLSHQNGNISGNPLLAYQEEAIKKSRQQLRQKRLNWLPDISLGYFQGTNDYQNARIYKGFEVGLSFPLFFGSQTAGTRAQRFSWEATQKEAEETERQLRGRLASLQAQLTKLEKALDVFESRGRDLSYEMIRTARRSYEEGEINMSEYVAAVEQARSTILDYLKNLKEYNRIVLEINYLIK
jgi:cobalt-zinc-cadmium resistance protein CzcA